MQNTKDSSKEKSTGCPYQHAFANIPAHRQANEMLPWLLQFLNLTLENKLLKDYFGDHMPARSFAPLGRPVVMDSDLKLAEVAHVIHMELRKLAIHTGELLDKTGLTETERQAITAFDDASEKYRTQLAHYFEVAENYSEITKIAVPPFEGDVFKISSLMPFLPKNQKDSYIKDIRSCTEGCETALAHATDLLARRKWVPIAISSAPPIAFDIPNETITNQTYPRDVCTAEQLFALERAGKAQLDRRKNSKDVSEYYSASAYGAADVVNKVICRIFEKIDDEISKHCKGDEAEMTRIKKEAKLIPDLNKIHKAALAHGSKIGLSYAYRSLVAPELNHISPKELFGNYIPSARITNAQEAAILIDAVARKTQLSRLVSLRSSLEIMGKEADILDIRQYIAENPSYQIALDLAEKDYEEQGAKGVFTHLYPIMPNKAYFTSKTQNPSTKGYFSSL